MSSTSGTSGSYTPKVEIEYQTQETTTTTLEPAPYPSTKIETGAVDTAHNYIEFKYQEHIVYKINFPEINS